MSPEIATDGSATQAYCIDDAVRRKFLSGEHYYELYTVTHLAAPESGWRGPVGHYRLVVDKRATANFVAFCPLAARKISPTRSEEHTSELQSLMRISYAVFCLKKKKLNKYNKIKP